MKKVSLILTMLLTGVSFSCSSDDDGAAAVTPPTASFSAVKNEKTVTFTNASTGADSYSWDFGDGNTSTELSPSHTYSDFGSFDVKLTATNEGGSDSRTIAVDLISVFQSTWTVDSALQTASSDFGGGNVVVSPTQLDNAQANESLSYLLAELISTNTNALALSLEQGGAVQLDAIATTISTWVEAGGELNIDSSVSVIVDNSDSIVGVLNSDGTITITFGDMGILSSWPEEFHVQDQPGQPGSGAFITSVTNVDSLVVELSAN